MWKMIASDRRVAAGMLAFVLLYTIWPVDLLPAMPFDDFAVAAATFLSAYFKVRSPKPASVTE